MWSAVVMAGIHGSTVTLVPGGYSQFHRFRPLAADALPLPRGRLQHLGRIGSPATSPPSPQQAMPGVPAAPSALQAVSKSATRIDLSWQHVGGVHSFRIERRIGIAPWRVLTTLRGNNLRTFIESRCGPEHHL